ncbi:hypothetical protein ACQY1Q_06120 [Tenacibaculum sp. TC6]|uniref:hypothetical protein n=1 Tax=Tenacibaculum sp. TC6 TaxID=3423223 RepID=UPI003D36ECD0
MKKLENFKKLQLETNEMDLINGGEQGIVRDYYFREIGWVGDYYGMYLVKSTDSGYEYYDLIGNRIYCN